MKRASKGYTGVDIPLFYAMIVQGPNFQGERSTVPVESHHTPTDEAASTCIDVRHGGAATTYDTTRIDGSMYHIVIKVESLEADLKQTKKVYGVAYTKLIMKMKKLEKTIMKIQSRRKAKIVVFDEEVYLEDPSKQGRSMIKEIDQDAEVTLVTLHRAVSTGSGGVSTASRMISTAKESVSTASASVLVSTVGMIDKGKGIMEESESDVTKTKRQQEQERLGLETAIRLQEQFDEEDMLGIIF
nr:hypothetical protein [Tanacetum cinerariifolium]